VALQLMFRYPCDPPWRECSAPWPARSWKHFERVLALLQRRGIPLRPPAAAGPTAPALASWAPAGAGRMLEQLSGGRLSSPQPRAPRALLGPIARTPKLPRLYGDLAGLARARHFGLYWVSVRAPLAAIRP